VREIVGALLGVVGLSVSALAADPPLNLLAATPVHNWSGLYVGGSASYGWGSFNPSTTTEFTPSSYFNFDDAAIVNAAGTGARVKKTGFVGGKHVGYNYQSGQLMVGAEVAFDSFNFTASRSGTAAYSGGSGSFVLNQTVNTEWLFMARGRVGWAANNLLFFGTGGVAVTHLKYNESFSDTFGESGNASFSKTLIGWIASCGVEYGITQNWSVGAEYLHLGFSNGLAEISLLNTSVGGPTHMFHRADLAANIVRLSANYRF
jgi:outer membrane immunogenic protein